MFNNKLSKIRPNVKFKVSDRRKSAFTAHRKFLFTMDKNEFGEVKSRNYQGYVLCNNDDIFKPIKPIKTQ